MAELLCRADLPKPCHDYAVTIQSSAEALLGILNDILDFSKMEAGKIALSPTNFDPSKSIQDVVSLFEPQAKSRGLSLTQQSNGLPMLIRLDDSRLRQILLNIVGNAVKFTEGGKVHIASHVEHLKSQERIVIVVSDTGIGIPANRLRAIFDSFSQADNDTTRRFGGTGLGLSISQNLARVMGGNISVTSSVGNGSKFKIVLPFAQPTAAEDAPQQQQPAIVPSGLTVLIAEDNKTNRLVIGRLLQGTDNQIHFAHDGEQAVALSREISPDVVFMDMNMPRMDGLKATRAIRALHHPQPRIVALTANGYASDRTACLQAGMDDFLTKPIRREDLLNALSTVGHQR